MTTEKEKIPSIVVLKPITPSVESARSGRLNYENLEPSVIKHQPYDHDRWNRFLNTPADSLEEKNAAEQLALQYLLMTSLALTKTQKPELSEVWSKRYTESTSSLYGVPESKIAQRLWDEQHSPDKEKAVEEFAEIAKLTGEYYRNKYGAVYEALCKDLSEEPITPSEIADRFEAALGVLADKFDPAWKDWVVERNEEKDSLSVEKGQKKIIVGMKRANLLPEQLVPIFTHEGLVHTLRAINGSKIDKQLGTGLPGYLDSEEGLGIFVEYALSGEIPQKSKDRYVDIAYALGLIDGKEHPRQELLDLVQKRALDRNDTAPEQYKKSFEDIMKEVYSHVNRIYRGSLGNEFVGIFTKDISYYIGFHEIANYIQSRVASGENVDDIMEFISTGKFDPTNPDHLEYLKTVS